MQDRLTPRDLHQIRRSFRGEQRIQHRLYLGEAARTVAGGRGIGEAGRAGQVAVIVDLDQGKAGVLFVIGAKAAIMGTAKLDMGLRRKRAVRWLDQIKAGILQ